LNNLHTLAIINLVRPSAAGISGSNLYFGCNFIRVKIAVNLKTKERVAVKILEKEKLNKLNLLDKIKKEVFGDWVTLRLQS
jgi:hypothetical protein